MTGLDPRTEAERDTLFERDLLPHLPAVARYAQSLARDEVDAGDLVQETFLRAYRFWTTFRAGSDGKRWLFTICRNVFLAQREREKVVVPAGDELEIETLAAVRQHNEAKGDGLDALFDRIDLAPAIQAAITALPSLQAEVVMLVDVQGLSYEEAAELVDVPVGTIRSRLYRARRVLQGALLEQARDAGYGRSPSR